jgi:hypothetical protein
LSGSDCPGGLTYPRAQHDETGNCMIAFRRFTDDEKVFSRGRRSSEQAPLRDLPVLAASDAGARSWCCFGWI